MIIDVHSHNFAPSVVVRAMSGMCRILGNRLYPSADGSLEQHLDNLEHSGVDKAVMCPIVTKPQHFDIVLRRSVEILSGAKGERAKRMIIPFGSLHPFDPHWSRRLDEIVRNGLVGVKFHSYYQEFSLADPKVWPMFRKIADLGLTVQIHAGVDLGYPNRRDFCGPEQIACLLRNVPRLKLIAAHLGGCGGFAPHATDELLDLGAYIDTSVLAVAWHRDEEMRLLRSWPRDRILFATDYPWESYSEALRWVSSIRAKEDLPLLLGGNAERLLFGKSQNS